MKGRFHETVTFLRMNKREVVLRSGGLEENQKIDKREGGGHVYLAPESIYPMQASRGLKS